MTNAKKEHNNQSNTIFKRLLAGPALGDSSGALFLQALS